jgi:hypothetical protein
MALGSVNSMVRAAHLLARTGHLDEANSLLEGIGESDLPVEGMLLRAKICAQQGDADGARACWQSSLQREPDNAEANAGLARIEARGIRSSSVAAVLRVTFVLAGVTVFAGFVYGLALLGGYMSGRVLAESAVASMAAPIAELSERVGVTRESVEDIATATQVNHDRFAVVQRLVDAHIESLDEFGKKLTVLDQRATDLSQAQADAQSVLTEQATQLSQSIQDVSTRNVEQSAALDQRLEAIETGATAARDASTRVGADLTKEIADRTAALENAIATLEIRLGENEAVLERLTQSVVAVNASLSANEAREASPQKKVPKRTAPWR